MRSRSILFRIQLIESGIHQRQGPLDLTGILGGVRGAHQHARMGPGQRLRIIHLIP